jgi:hypothetical protein
MIGPATLVLSTQLNTGRPALPISSIQSRGNDKSNAGSNLSRQVLSRNPWQRAGMEEHLPIDPQRYQQFK